MKRVLSVLLVMVCLVGVAYADVITIDTETASVEEMESAVLVLEGAIKARKGTGGEMYTFQNGMSVSVASVTKGNGTITVVYRFAHTKTTPIGFRSYMWARVFQNGIELDEEFSFDNYEAQTRQVLMGTILEVPYTYQRIDNSPLTFYLVPWFASEDPYIVTIPIE